MNFEIYSHRFALPILETEPDFIPLWEEVQEAIFSISDEILISRFEESDYTQTSISRQINELLSENLTQFGWEGESPIFQNNHYRGDTWRLDFAKELISIEVAFNHSSVIAWNLLKPVLAGELNHVQKAIQTELGIIICATNELKRAGGFDGSIGSFEKYIDFLIPLRNQLSIPILLIGLEAPETFRIEHTRIGNRNVGRVVRGV